MMLNKASYTPCLKGAHCLGSVLKKVIDTPDPLRPELNNIFWFKCIWLGEFRYPGFNIADIWIKSKEKIPILSITCCVNSMYVKQSQKTEKNTE